MKNYEVIRINNVDDVFKLRFGDHLRFKDEYAHLNDSDCYISGIMDDGSVRIDNCELVTTHLPYAVVRDYVIGVDYRELTSTASWGDGRFTVYVGFIDNDGDIFPVDHVDMGYCECEEYLVKGRYRDLFWDGVLDWNESLMGEECKLRDWEYDTLFSSLDLLKEAYERNPRYEFFDNDNCLILTRDEILDRICATFRESDYKFRMVKFEVV